MWAWRRAMQDVEDEREEKGFYTRGRRIEKLPACRRRGETVLAPKWEDIHLAYVQNTFTRQIGYSLRFLGFTDGKKLLDRGIKLAKAFIDNTLQQDLADWLEGKDLRIKEPLFKLKSDNTCSPDFVSETECKIVDEVLWGYEAEVFGPMAEQAKWRKTVRDIMRRWEDDFEESSMPERLAAHCTELPELYGERVRHVAHYESLRIAALEELGGAIKGLLYGNQTSLNGDNVAKLHELSERISIAQPFVHDQARSLVIACRAENPVVELCRLAEGLCLVSENGKLDLLDRERAHRVAEQWGTAGSSKEDDEEGVWVNRSFRSYQLLNLWWIEYHLKFARGGYGS